MSAPPVNAVDAYERLRAAVLDADPNAGPNLGILRREGLIAWSQSLIEARDIGLPLPGPARQTSGWSAAAQTPSELIRLIASIVLAITADPAHV